MKRQEKFGIAFWIFVLIMMLMGLCGCSTTATESIADSVKNDLNALEKQVKVVEGSLSTECKTPIVKAELEVITQQIKSINQQADSIVLSCKAEKESLTQRIDKLYIIILVLVITCVFLIRRK